MSEQVASQTKRFPFFYGTIVMPSGHFPSERSRPVGCNLIKFFIIQMAGLLRRQKLPRHLFFMIGHFHCFVSRYSVFDIILYMRTSTL